MSKIENLAAHEFFLANGYKHTHHQDTFEDVGDAESGPMLEGGPAFDEYECHEECVFISWNATDREIRDHAREQAEAEFFAGLDLNAGFSLPDVSDR